jgi:predicted hotdog family 3-hydroxylacyl-ACP dehydratase
MNTASANELPELCDVVPHRGDALLLDRILAADASTLIASLRVRAGTAFSDDAGALPAWAAPEIMAQAVAAYAGCIAQRERRCRAELGLLLGVRDATTIVAAFHPGDELRVEVTCSSADDEGRGVFDCRLLDRDHRVVATATLTAFQPPDAEVLRQLLAAG